VGRKSNRASNGSRRKGHKSIIFRLKRRFWSEIKRNDSTPELKFGAKVLQEKEKILERFSNHFNQLLNIQGELDKAAKNSTKVTCRTFG